MLCKVCFATHKFGELVVSGGGAKFHAHAYAEEELEPDGLKIRSTNEFGLPAEAKEATAFALLAHEPGIGGHRMCLQRPGRNELRFWGKSRTHKP
jgi:1,6-anhydro-N-acetylmuramate kinase